MVQVHFDKWVHFGLFAVLLFLWRMCFLKNTRSVDAIILLLAGIYGLSIELIQKEWIPNRSFDWFDLLADMVGSIAGVVFYMWVYKKNKPL